MDKVGLKPETAIGPSKRKRGALADITIPNQTKKATKVGTDSNPKHSKPLARKRQSALTMNKNRIPSKSVRVGPQSPAKVVIVTRPTLKKTASRRITSREQSLVKDTTTVAPSMPARNPKLYTLRPATGGNDTADSDQPSQESEIVQEEGLNRTKRKRRKLSEALVDGKPKGHGSDLRPCSEALIRAEDGEPDDLDKEDVADPCMEPEYQVECYQYMRELEVSGHYF